MEENRGRVRSFLDASSFEDFGGARTHHLEGRLISAVEHDDVHAVASLLHRGSSPNVRCHGESEPYALHVAVDRLCVGVTCELLAGGADVNVRNAFGETPLLIACHQRSFAMVSLLLRCGASPSIPDRRECFPQDCARFRPMGSVLDRCLAARIRCPRIPLLSDFVRIVRHRGVSMALHSSDLQLDMNSQLDLEMLYMCYLSVLSLGGYYQVCDDQQWDRVHFDMTGTAAESGIYTEHLMYSRYILLVEDELYDCCPPSSPPPPARERMRPVCAEEDYAHDRFPPVKPPARHLPHFSKSAEHRSAPLPRRTPSNLVERPTATHGHATNAPHRSRHRDSAVANRDYYHQPRAVAAPAKSNRDPRLARDLHTGPAPGPTKQEDSSKRQRTPPADSSSWSTSRGLSTSVAVVKPERRQKADEQPPKRSLFDKFKLDADVSRDSDTSKRRHNSQEAASKPVPVSAAAAAAKGSAAFGSRSGSGAHSDSASKDKLWYSSTSQKTASSSSPYPGQRKKLTVDHADARASPSSQASSDSMGSRRSMGGVTSVLEKLTASLYDEPAAAVPAPADSTTSDLPQSQATAANAEAGLGAAAVVLSEGTVRASVKVESCGGRDEDCASIESMPSLPSLVMASDVEDELMDAKSLADSVDDVQFVEDDDLSLEVLSQRSHYAEDDQDDCLSMMSGASSPYRSPSPLSGEDSDSDGKNGPSSGVGDQSSTRPRANLEVRNLAISSPALLPPAKDDASLPDFIADPSLLTREQRKLQQTLQQFQIMEMRASALAHRRQKSSNRRGNLGRKSSHVTGKGASSSSNTSSIGAGKKTRTQAAPYRCMDGKQRRGESESSTDAHHPGRCLSRSQSQSSSDANWMRRRSSTVLAAARVKAREKLHRSRRLARHSLHNRDGDHGQFNEGSRHGDHDLGSDGSAKTGKKFQDFQPVILPTRFRSSRAASVTASLASSDKQGPGEGGNTVGSAEEEEGTRSVPSATQDEQFQRVLAEQQASEFVKKKKQKRVAENKPKDSKGETPLHRAARSGNVKRVHRCLTSETVINAKDNAGWTPLHEAINKNHLDVAEVLLQHGAIPDVIATDGTTPLDDAVESDCLEGVRLLLRFGANPTCASNATCLMVPEDTDCAKVFNEALSLCREISAPCERASKTRLPGLRSSSEDLKDMEPGLRKQILSLQHFLKVSGGEIPHFYTGAAFEVSDVAFLPTYSLAAVPGGDVRHNFVLVEDVLEAMDYEPTVFVKDYPQIHELNITMKVFRTIYQGSLFNPAEPLDRFTAEKREDNEEISLFLWNDALRSILGIPLVVL